MAAIIDTIACAPSPHVVYFLVTVYLEACAHVDAAHRLPAQVKHLPVAGDSDLMQRLRALRAASSRRAPGAVDAFPAVSVTLEVLSAASQRLMLLDELERQPQTWNVVDNSKGGHQRRRRLGWRMTARQAAEWSSANGMQLERAEEAAPRR